MTTLEHLQLAALDNQDTWGFWPTFAFDPQDWQDSLDHFEGNVSELVKYFQRIHKMRTSKNSDS